MESDLNPIFRQTCTKSSFLEKKQPNFRFQLSFYAISGKDFCNLMNEKTSCVLLLCIKKLSKEEHLDEQIQDPNLMQLLKT